MRALQRWLTKAHPLLKSLLYLQLLSIAIWGPLISVIVVSTVCFAFLIFYSGEKGAIANPYYALLFCVIAVLIVLPGGNRDELIYASKLSARILNVMLISAMLGVVVSPVDIARVGKYLRLPDTAIMMIIGVASFLPLSLRSINTVIFAQRSRGLDFNLFSLFRPTTYRVLVVPYVVCILRSALDKWVSMNLRPWSGYKLAMPKIAIHEIVLFLISLILWLGAGWDRYRHDPRHLHALAVAGATHGLLYQSTAGDARRRDHAN
jgi:energy-coupling factor transport system permease protein